MNDLIPRIEWNEQSVTATRTINNPTLSGISSTDAINVGMVASGTGIPTGATVLSKTVSSVTLSANASASGTSVINFVERLDFEYPPKSDTEEDLQPKQSILESLSGVKQYQTNYLEAVRELEFQLVNQTLSDKLRNNFYIYVYSGNTFKYYQDKDVASYETVEIDQKSFQRRRQTSRGSSFYYAIKFNLRRVVS